MLIEKLDTEGLVQDVLCKAWDELERALMIDSSDFSENNFIHLCDSQREQPVCAVSTETASSAFQEIAKSPFSCLAVCEYKRCYLNVSPYACLHLNVLL